MNNMEFIEYRLKDIFVNYDNLRKPLSAMERSTFQGEYPYYGAQGIIDYVKEYRCDGEYLLIAEDGENLNSRNQPIALIAKGKFWVNNHAHIVKTNDLADMKFACYALNHMDINGYVTGTAQPKLSQKNLNHIKVKFPAKEYQLAIVNILSTYDELIENNNKRIAILEQMAENLYKEWFVRFRFPGYETAKFENGIPKGWGIKKLFDIANVKYGYAFKSELFCDDVALTPVVRIRDVPNNKSNTYTSEVCDKKYLIEENSILIGMDGIFHMCLWNGEKAYLNQRVVEIRSKKECLSNLHLFFALLPQVKYWEQTIAGTTVAHLGDKHIKKMTVIMPDEKIARKATAIFNEIMIQKNTLFKQNQNLTKQRDLLLPRLMSGKLEVKE